MKVLPLWHPRCRISLQVWPRERRSVCRYATHTRRKKKPPDQTPGGSRTSCAIELWVLGALGGLIPSLGLVPVHHIPPRSYVLGSPVLVGEVVGVLPHIQPNYRRLALHQRAILVGTLLDGERSVGGGDEPHPATPENAPWRSHSRPLLLELIKRTEGGVYGPSKLSCGLSSSLATRPHDLPEHRMVGVSASVV